MTTQSAQITITSLVGKRILAKTKARNSGPWATDNVGEFRVLEASPSGVWVKIQNLYGNKYWMPLTDLSLLEELREIKPV